MLSRGLLKQQQKSETGEGNPLDCTRDEGRDLLSFAHPLMSCVHGVQ